jgi:hypothetical protein
MTTRDRTIGDGGPVACDTFGSAGPDDIRRAQFVIANVPAAAVRQHL